MCLSYTLVDRFFDPDTTVGGDDRIDAVFRNTGPILGLEVELSVNVGTELARSLVFVTGAARRCIAADDRAARRQRERVDSEFEILKFRHGWARGTGVHAEIAAGQKSKWWGFALQVRASRGLRHEPDGCSRGQQLGKILAFTLNAAP